MTSVTKLVKTSSEIVIYADMNSIKTNVTSHHCQFAAPFVFFAVQMLSVEYNTSV